MKKKFRWCVPSISLHRKKKFFLPSRKNKFYQRRTLKRMALICKRQRNRDRISNLPDNLITHILSFLSTMDAVKTSILSTSWNQQWTLVPLIRINDEIILPWTRTSSPSFVNFVNRVLLYKVAPLDLFQLNKGMIDANDVSNWISIALSRHVRQINVDATMPIHCYLPDSLYSSKTLVVLKLKGPFVFRLPEKISLESLKIFHYQADDYDVGDNYDVGESIFRIVSSCPVLEELEIIDIMEENLCVLNITSLALKRLILKDMYQNHGRIHPYKLVLNTPNLQYLEHRDIYGVANSYKIYTLHCLDTARFDFTQARPLAELVVAISNVRVLNFKINLRSALPNFELPKFDRLISLELEPICSKTELRLLISFLQSSRQLESLSFYLGFSSDEAWYPPTDVPFCMIYNLKVIKVDYFYEDELLLNVLAYFLEKTNCLQELIILDSEEKDEEFIKKVSMLPRASNSSQILLS